MWEDLETEARVDEPPRNGARAHHGFDGANSFSGDVNHKGNGFRKIEALQMAALNGTGDNWEVPHGMEIDICCFELKRQGS